MCMVYSKSCTAQSILTSAQNVGTGQREYDDVMQNFMVSTWFDRNLCPAESHVTAAYRCTQHTASLHSMLM